MVRAFVGDSTMTSRRRAGALLVATVVVPLLEGCRCCCGAPVTRKHGNAGRADGVHGVHRRRGGREARETCFWSLRALIVTSRRTFVADSEASSAFRHF